ncbi:hypothetical protein BGP_0854 [Beggiatoa sp. PS]|nr:hypothetical protein BGP_0854 [Beggiatoa sp. PS]
MLFYYHNDRKIAQIATESTYLHYHRNFPNQIIFINRLLSIKSVLGIITTHSGTCLGLLFPKGKIDEIGVTTKIHSIYSNVSVSKLDTLQFIQ